MVRTAHEGALPSSAHWLCDSSLVYLRKPSTDTPRPIRVGEFWRRVIAKRFAFETRRWAQQLLVKHRQGGVSLPGGAEALVHLRRQLEATAACSSTAVAVLDLDLRNAFPSLEWSAVRAAVQKRMPELLEWSQWCQSSPGRVRLPCGDWVECDRGAEQGDPLGPLYCALTLLDCAEAARAAVRAKGFWVWDLWYMDDGQIVLPPAAASIFLEAFDSALLAVGGTRIGTDGKCKSTAKLLGSELARSEVPSSWCDGVVQETCKLRPDAPGGVVLGVGITAVEVAAQFEEAAANVATVHKALRQIDDPASELSLLRSSLSACRVVHLLRGAGPELSEVAMADFDEGVEQALAELSGGELASESWAQAATGARDGGLGLRQTADLQYPAYLASLIEARPLATELADLLPEWLRTAVMNSWDETQAAARTDWLSSLPPQCRGVGTQLLDEGESEAQNRVAVLLGRAPPIEPAAPNRPAAVAASLVAPVGSEDPEYPGGQTGNLQTRLSDLVGRHRVGELARAFELRGDWDSVKRLSDLRDPGTDHTWLWAVSSPLCGGMDATQFSTALRLRLGGSVIDQPAECSVCGGILDTRGLHALRCAPGEATRGHNAVRDQVLGLASLGDTAACSEPRGLIPSRPGLRPADILSTAAFARLTALDVGVTCPGSAGSGNDACAGMVMDKMDKYRPHLDELKDNSVYYMPLVWSCWGRPHEDASAAIRSMAAAAARRRGGLFGQALAARASSLVGLQLAKRAARMVHTCQPRTQDADSRALLDAAISDARKSAGLVDEWGVDVCSAEAVGEVLDSSGAGCAAPAAPAAPAGLEPVRPDPFFCIFTR